MKYKLILLLFVVSCSNYSSNVAKKSGYSSSGFAYIEKNSLLNLDNDKFFISHNKLKAGTKIKITNPDNKKSLELITKKKIKYDNFYKALISSAVAEELKLSLKFPCMKG